MKYRAFFRTAILGLLLSVNVVLAQGEATAIQKLFTVKASFPEITVVGVVVNPNESGAADRLKKINIAAASTGIQVVVAEASNLKELAEAFTNLVAQYKVQLVWVEGSDDLLNGKVSRDYLVKNATLKKMPLLAADPQWVDLGALMAVRKVDGKARLYLNTKAAKAIGLSYPENLAETADFFAAN